MSDTTISPNMGLILPTVSEDPGPDWATNLNASLTAIDSHNHSSGQGVSITPDGLNINADLPMNNSNLITAKTVRFTPQSAIVSGGANIGCLQEVGVDLYYIDGSGNQIRITQSGSVTGSAGTITGLPSGTASAAFAAGTFTFQKSTGVPASFNIGSIKIGQEVASGFGVTVSANVGQAANYNMGLPAALPASTKIMTLDASGNIGATYVPDNSSIEVSSSIIQVKAAGITRTMLAAIGQGLSASCGTYTTTSGTYSSITNLQVSGVVTTGRMVMISMVPVGDTNDSSYILPTTNAFGEIRCERAGNNIGTIGFADGLNPQSLVFYDFPTAGTYTYTMFGRVIGSVGSMDVKNYKLLVYEVA